MTQFVPFSNGGFALFRINVSASKPRVSAWFNADGKLIGTEYSDKAGRSRTLRAKDDLNKVRGIGLAEWLVKTAAGRAAFSATQQKA